MVLVEKIKYEEKEIHHECDQCDCPHTLAASCEHDAYFLVCGILELCEFHLRELGHCILLMTESR